MILQDASLVLGSKSLGNLFAFFSSQHYSAELLQRLADCLMIRISFYIAVTTSQSAGCLEICIWVLTYTAQLS